MDTGKTISAPGGTIWAPGALADPHADAAKPAKVRGMFAAIARRYDLNNRVHSLWMDQWWRSSTVRLAGLRPGDEVLDAACGTGDLAQAFVARGAARVVGVDFTPEMLALAERKRARLRPAHAARLRYMEGDATNLPIADASFDVVSIAFGLRNVGDPLAALREFVRVLRPGGRVVVLEFERPGFAPLRWFNDFYCGRVMPVTATLLSGDRSGAYRYLPRSVGTFMPRGALIEVMRGCGLVRVEAHGLAPGLCACYRGLRKGKA